MEAIFNKVLNLICKHFDFSFTIGKHADLELLYNGGAGNVRIMLNNDFAGVRSFINALVSHPNKTAAKIDPAFFSAVPEPEQNEDTGHVYKLTKRKVYFDAETSELLDSNNLDWTNPNLAWGCEVETTVAPGFLIVSHPGTGFDVSIVHNGILYGVQLYEGKQREKIEAFLNDIAEFEQNELVEALTGAN